MNLFKFFRLGVDGDADPPPPDPGDTLDDLLDAIEPTPPAKADEDEGGGDAAAAQRAAEAEARAAQAEKRAAEAEARAARAAVQPAPTRQTDPQWEAEERQLAEARNLPENDQKWLKWKIDTDRSVRAGTQRADATFQAAADRADRAEFATLEFTKPRVFKAYNARVEEALAGFQRQGGNIPPRKMILTYLIGQDILEGKVKPKKVSSSASEPAPKQVDRGTLPNARSDVRKGSAALTEREKRRQRLDGKPI